jgi:hypothetical protein
LSAQEKFTDAALRFLCRNRGFCRIDDGLEFRIASALGKHGATSLGLQKNSNCGAGILNFSERLDKPAYRFFVGSVP